MNTVKALCLAALFVSASGFRRGRQEDGPCPEVVTVPEMDLGAYLGNWFETVGSIWQASPEGSTCLGATYTLRDDGLVSVVNQEIRGNTGEWDDACGAACQADPEGRPGCLYVTFAPVAEGDASFCAFDDPSTAPTNYQILGTDYGNYSSVYSCEDTPDGGHFEQLYILTRSDDPSDDVINTAAELFTANGIDVGVLVPFPSGDEAGCLYNSGDPENPTTCLYNIPPPPPPSMK